MKTGAAGMAEVRVAHIPSMNTYIRRWRGGCYKTEMVRQFEKAVLRQLPAFLPMGGEDTRCLSIVFILRRDNRDIDNLPKVFIDCLQKRYGFNDKSIEILTLEKRIDRERKNEAIMFRFGESGRQL